MAIVLLFASLLLCTAGIAYGNGPHELIDHYQGQYGFFTHWSAVVQATRGGKASLGYSVCDVDKQALFFYWEGPGFGSGWRYPLEPGTCATLTRTVAKYHEDDGAYILFTQHNQKVPANAYLAAGKPSLPQGWLTRVVGFFRHEGFDPNIVDLSIRVVVTKDKKVTYTLTWPQGIMTFAAGFDLKNLSTNARTTVLAELAKMGVKARYVEGAALFKESDVGHLPAGAGKTSYLVLNPSPSGPLGVRFSYDAKEVTPATEPMMAIDEEGQVISVASYTTVR